MLSLLLFFYPTTSFCMLQRAHRQESQRRIQEHVKKLQSVDEVNLRIDRMRDNVSNECIEELARITDKPYDLLKSTIDLERDITKEILKIPNPQATHDSRIPASLYKTMRTNMLDEGVNPQSTTLKYKPDSQNTHLFGDSRGIVFIYGSLILRQKIQLYPPLLQRSKDYQAFTCRHELWHILLQHSSMHYTANTYSSNADKKRLHSVIEREADIYAASKNSRLACAGAIDRCQFGHAEILDKNSHCTQMLTMCELLKRKEELS